jgi:2-polyprenyl-3-methyl-5-hydroxy-6-metoxy-1,4-benzoquinol methylase
MQPSAPAASAAFFQAKYTTGNAISRRLVGGFFDALGRAVAGVGNVRRVLEVGCGEGVSTERLGQMLPPDATLRAGDIDADRLAAARQRNPGVAFANESIYELSCEDRSFDLVVMLEVLEHLADPVAALREACRASRRWVICSVPREPLWRALNLARGSYVGSLGNTPGHLNHWSARSFTRFVGSQLDVRQRLSPLPWTMIVGEVRR